MERVPLTTVCRAATRSQFYDFGVLIRTTHTTRRDKVAGGLRDNSQVRPVRDMSLGDRT